MIRSRRHLLPLWIGLLCMAERASALGLGDVQVNSHLGEPLDASVQLLDQSDNNLRVAIGQQGDYQALGIEYSNLHAQLSFEPVAINGAQYLRIRSDAPVHEPYLDFVLRLRDSQGQLIREVTILLDPRPQPGGSVLQPTQVVEQQNPSAHTYRQLAAPVNAAPVKTVEVEALAAGAYRVKAGDSLWKIAARALPQGASQEETMDAILALNPKAFIANDPARIMLGARLHIPSAQQIAELRSQVDQPQQVASAAAPAVIAQSMPVPSLQAPVQPVQPAQQQVETLPSQPVEAVADSTADVALADVLNTKAQLAEFQAQKAELSAELERLSLVLAHLNKRLAQANRNVGDLYETLDPTAAGQVYRPMATPQPANNLLSVLVPEAKADTSIPFMMMPSASAAQSNSSAQQNWWNMMLAWAALAGVGIWMGLRIRAKKLQAKEHLAWPLAKNWKELKARDFSNLTEHSHEPANFNLPLSEEPEALADISVSLNDHQNVKSLAAQLTAFGRYEEAETLIMSELRKDPDITAYQLLLLNIYLQTNRLEQFRKLEAKLVMQKLSSEEIMQLRAIKANYSARYGVHDSQVKFRRVI